MPLEKSRDSENSPEIQALNAEQTRPKFNSKYTDDNLNHPYKSVALGVQQTIPSQRQKSTDSSISTSPNTSRNSSHTTHKSLAISPTSMVDPKRRSSTTSSYSIDPVVSSNSSSGSKLHSNFMPLRAQSDKALPSSFKVSRIKSKRASLLNRLIPSRRESEPIESYEFLNSGRNISAPSMTRKSDPSHSSFMTTFSSLGTNNNNHNNNNNNNSSNNNNSTNNNINNNNINNNISNNSHSHIINSNHSHGLSHSHNNNDKIRSLPLSTEKLNIHNISQTKVPLSIDSSISVAPTSRIPQPFGIDLNDDDDDISSITKLSDTGMSRIGSMASIITEPESRSFWRPPESWKVRTDTITTQEPPVASSPNDNPTFPMARSTSELSSSSYSSDSEKSSFNPIEDNKKTISEVFPSINSASSIKIAQSAGTHNSVSSSHSKELKGASRSSVRIFKGDKSSLLPCTLETTCKDILDVLRRKRFLKSDEDHILVLNCGGLRRTLALHEKPLKIQRTMLFLYGYTERDNLDYIERTDLSFLFKFMVQDKGVEFISEEKKRLINPQNVDLANWNLQEVPNFLYAEPIITLDVSQNPSFEFTKDFMHDSRNLTTLNFTRSGNPKFPLSIVYAPRLVNLDLEVNYIKSIPSEISMLSNLTILNLACNRIYHLPDSFAELQNLQSLNLSSNRIKEIPRQINKMKSLKRLDLSYNSISVISSNLAGLTSLEVLQISGNKLSHALPDFFAGFNNLIKVDVRFNQLTSIDTLKNSPKLEVIRATGNNISVFSSSAVTLFEVELNMNPLTYVYFESDMPNLKVVDFSKGKLTSCSFAMKLTNVEKLALDNNHLSILPDDISKMKNLVHFSAFKNNINSIPDSFGKLSKLKYLDLHLNNIGSLNQHIWSLGSLEILNLASNLLASFPEPPDHMYNQFSPTGTAEKFKDPHDPVFWEDNDEEPIGEAVDEVTELPGALSPLPTSTAAKRRSSEAGSVTISLIDKDSFDMANSLKQLCLCDNKLNDTVIPTISLFHNLQCLNLCYNDIFEIPSGYLSNLKQLKNLFLSGNYLSSLPIEDFDSFEHLATLHLNGNRFGTLPAELSKIKNLLALDIGSNALKYNIGNIPYDWNWCYNKKLKYLNFSGNKRLEIKPQHKREGVEDQLDSFLGLKNLMMLGLMDVTITTDAVPDQSVGVRVRSTVSQLGKFGYGISDTLGDTNSLTTRDVVLEKFRGNPDELLITIYDGKNSAPKGGDKISKIIQETFEIHLTEELQSLGTVVVPGLSPKSVEDCLRGAFLTMNSEMNILINKDESSTFSSAAVHRTKTTDKLTLEEDGYSGCCATIIYIKGDELYVANVGDTMGILTRADGEFNVITSKHEPYAPKEYERIRDSGGYVTTDGYLDGVSDVSRAVGYFKLIPHINAQPSVHKFKLTQNEEMIAIGTNEIWKRVPFDLAADIIRQEKSNPNNAAEKLRDFAISYGGRGKKLTAVVLSLRQFTTKQKHHGTSQPEDSTLRKLDEEIVPPTGDLAMVFTDIKNSTLLWDNYPVAMRSAIKVHNAIMRRQLRIIGGYEVKTEGDAFVVSFPTPTSALLWCFTVQWQLLITPEWPAEILTSDQGCEIKDNEGNLIFRGLSVRMGVHWGTPVCERDIVTRRMDYFGPMVNRASRVSSVADGGQITMSTDFYYEFEKIKKTHLMIKDGKVDVSRAYGYKARGKDIENQMEQLEHVGWVLENIGAKKLKGLETPENIWLVFPRGLSSRLKVLTSNNGQIQNKSTQLVVGGITAENVWQLRKISLRMEKICSFLANDELRTVPKTHLAKVTEEISADADIKIHGNFANLESVLLLFLDHTITRIENCVTVLGIRQIAGQDDMLRCDTNVLFDVLKGMKLEIESLKEQLTLTNA